MNPSDLPQCSVFFLPLLLFIITVQADHSFTNCSSRFSCGIVNNVGYPFWGDNRADYCGQPGFELACQGNDPKLIVKSITYRILSFNSNNQSLKVVRDDYWTTLCPSQYKNTNFVSTMFELVDGFQEMVLLYDCIDTFSMVQFTTSSGTECSISSGSKRNVYYGKLSDTSIDLTGVCKVVVIPIMNALIDLVFSRQKGIKDAIDEGFELRWSVDNDECNKCVSSGGQCGYSNNQKFSCFCPNGLQVTTCSSSSGTSSSNQIIIIIAIASAGSGVAIVICIAIICYSRSFRLGQKIISKERRTYHDHHVETFMETYGTLAPRKYTYSEVRRITKSFATKIGQGGYGIVYKATMPDGRLVAVKVLSETKGNNGEEFINEVASISRTSHVNIVSLLGFCYEKNKTALIYEFMPNGSLDKFIYKGEYSLNPICDFEWTRLYRISIGIAQGLEYLHQGCNTRILHLDIKPQNILLDEDFCPKISDFGLAKICHKKESIVSIFGMRGTAGYIAPEVFSRTYGGVSYKSDVYSYGMLILEMIGGRKNFESGGSSQSHTNSDIYFPNWIYKEFEQSNFNVNVARDAASITEGENEVVRKLTLVGLWCIQTNPANRPSKRRSIQRYMYDVLINFCCTRSLQVIYSCFGSLVLRYNFSNSVQHPKIFHNSYAILFGSSGCMGSKFVQHYC